MRKLDGEYIFSTSDLLTFMESEFASWMDRFDLENPGEVMPDPEDEQMQILHGKGLEHERSVLSSLQEEGYDICEIPIHNDAYQATLDAMRAGRGILYQAALRHENFAGFADFLARVQGESKLGDFHYEVWDTKLAHKAKPYFIIQLCGYAEMLEAVQGYRPKEIQIVLGTKERRRFRTDDYIFLYRQLKKAFLGQQASFDPNQKPVPSGSPTSFGRWRTHAEQILEQRDHLSRVANIRTVQIRRLEKEGISMLRTLAETTRSHIPKMRPATFDQLRRQARLQLESAGLPRPRYELLDPDPLNPRRGLTLLPPPSPQDVCFDMEGYPFTEGGLEYLFGVTYLQGKKLAFKDWWAHNRDEEKAAFEGFIDWVCERRAQDPAMHIYHYAAYEVTAVRRLMGRYGTRETEVDDLLRNEGFVDLYTIVRQALRVGEPSYSLKNIEHLYMDARAGSVSTATESMVYYQRWLESGTDAGTRDSRILADVRAYNKEDCDSTWKLTKWLRTKQREAGVSWIPKPARAEAEKTKPSPRDKAAALAELLFAELPSDRRSDPERWRIQELLAWLLGFHRREEKPLWWSMFGRQAMTEEQLIDDMESLGGLQRSAKPVRGVGQSDVYEYSFDPDQDTKISKGDRCRFAHDLQITAVIEEIDQEKGCISIKLGPSAPIPPPRLSLIRVDHYPADAIVKSIYRTALEWARSRSLPRALEDLLYRRRPRIRGIAQGPIVSNPKRRLEEAIRAVVNLERSTLCIQGPPGSGKTYTAAHCILELLRQGKRVGVTSNSHKAICKLMTTVAEEAAKAGQPVRGVKIGDEDSDDPRFLNSGILRTREKRQVFQGPYSKVLFVGGTAWIFSDAMAAGKFDYLFVDEAGQVSLANLVGMAPCAENLVLVGDQMQLSQPLKGAHPGESGQSALEYLLQMRATIPDDFGIFLGTTWRMHPDLCRFISGAVYEDRLLAEPHTASRRLSLPRQRRRWITHESGILYIPIEHEGNSQGSEEEAEVIGEVVDELLRCKWAEKKDSPARPLTMQDILLVAPYNMQVRLLRSRIPGARVGSVDKFQGQEAPVVLISMCSSTSDASPRGMEFLFSRNRLNVAISRAQSLAIVVASPALARAHCSSVEQMALANLFCRIVESGSA